MNKILNIALLSLVIVCTGFAGNDGLKGLQSKFNSLTDFTADFRQTTAGKISGKMYYKKGDKYRLEMSTNTTVSNGETVWNYNKKEKKVFINDADDNSANSFSLNAIINNYPEKCTVTEEKDGNLTLVTLTPKKGIKLMFRKVKLWINGENLLVKTEVLLGKQPMVFEFSNYKLNQNLSEDVFRYTAPKGTEVVDLRN